MHYSALTIRLLSQPILDSEIDDFRDGIFCNFISISIDMVIKLQKIPAGKGSFRAGRGCERSLLIINKNNSRGVHRNIIAFCVEAFMLQFLGSYFDCVRTLPERRPRLRLVIGF